MSKRRSLKGTGQHLISNQQLLELLKREKLIAPAADSNAKSGLLQTESGEGISVLYLKKASE